MNKYTSMTLNLQCYRINILLIATSYQSLLEGWQKRTPPNSSDIHCDSKVKDNTKDGTCKSRQKKWHYIIWGNLGIQGASVIILKNFITGFKRKARYTFPKKISEVSSNQSSIPNHLQIKHFWRMSHSTVLLSLNVTHFIVKWELFSSQKAVPFPC